METLRLLPWMMNPTCEILDDRRYRKPWRWISSVLVSQFVDRRFDELDNATKLIWTPDYVASEIIFSQAHSFSINSWSCGIVIEKLIVGVVPFHSKTKHETYQRVLQTYVTFPQKGISQLFVVFVKKIFMIKKHFIPSPPEITGNPIVTIVRPCGRFKRRTVGKSAKWMSRWLCSESICRGPSSYNSKDCEILRISPVQSSADSFDSVLGMKYSHLW